MIADGIIQMNTSIHPTKYTSTSLFFPPSFIGYNLHLTLCKFKIYDVMIWYMCILQYGYHNEVS